MSNFWIETFTGKRFDFIDLESNEIDITDIAHALSLSCRFNGHCNKFYSVAEHSVRVSDILETKVQKLAGLLHDASEAYLSDITRPFKSLFPEYKVYERKIQDYIYLTFGVSSLLSSRRHNYLFDDRIIKRADNILLATEARDLMSQSNMWNLFEEPLVDKIVSATSEKAEENFLFNFYKLTER